MSTIEELEDRERRSDYTITERDNCIRRLAHRGPIPRRDGM